MMVSLNYIPFVQANQIHTIDDFWFSLEKEVSQGSFDTLHAASAHLPNKTKGRLEKRRENVWGRKKLLLFFFFFSLLLERE